MNVTEFYIIKKMSVFDWQLILEKMLNGPGLNSWLPPIFSIPSLVNNIMDWGFDFDKNWNVL